MPYTNIGILAHVDAGKTSLTEYILYRAGVIRAPGRVDAGTTQTDTLDLERQRGITIKSAVASFVHQGVTVNLIDTPGHPDFIAEVERALRVLDGAVLVVSAVEGIQPQTRILLRVLERLRLPTLVFLNKLDRRGADPHRVTEALRSAVAAAVVSMVMVEGAGNRAVRVIARPLSDFAFRDEVMAVSGEGEDVLVERYLECPEALGDRELESVLAHALRAGRAYPLYLGSAMTGVGVDHLMDGLATLLPGSGPGVGEERGVSAEVFKVERRTGGRRAAYVRVRSGVLWFRDRVEFGQSRSGTVSGLETFDGGLPVRASLARAGQIARVYGLEGIRIGDVIGHPGGPRLQPVFLPPLLESALAPVRPGDRVTLFQALSQLSEEDPLIGLRRDPERDQVLVSLYGEVQQEVILETLRRDFHVEAQFRESRVLHVERPVAVADVSEEMGAPHNPFQATVGLRIEPAPEESGIRYGREVELGSLPLAFHEAVEEAVRDALAQGLFGWPVTGCRVVMTRSGYNSITSTAGDFRHLARMVVMTALIGAQTEVLEPYHRFQLEVPEPTAGTVFGLLVRRRGVAEQVKTGTGHVHLEGVIPAREIADLRRELPGRSRGEGVLVTEFDRYLPVQGDPPARPRTGPDPGNREAYLMWVRRVREV